MNKALLAIVVLAIIIGGGYYLYQSRTPASAPAPAPAVAPPPAPVPDVSGRIPFTHTIIMDAAGFTPASVTIRAGDFVVFLNKDTRDRWPASGVHPTHLLCPGFDSLKPLKQGEIYSHQFTVAKECPFHDHLIPTLRGKIRVTESKG